MLFVLLSLDLWLGAPSLQKVLQVLEIQKKIKQEQIEKMQNNQPSRERTVGF